MPFGCRLFSSDLHGTVRLPILGLGPFGVAGRGAYIQKHVHCETMLPSSWGMVVNQVNVNID